MHNPVPTDTSRQLGKLIAAVQKKWQGELGEPQAAETLAVLQKTRRLLTILPSGKARAELGGLGLADYLGTGWLAGNPWALPHISRIEALLAHEGDQDTENSPRNSTGMMDNTGQQ